MGELKLSLYHVLLVTHTNFTEINYNRYLTYKMTTLDGSRWKGRLAIVTGASAGIGAAICRSLVDAGMVVAGLARREDRVKELADELSGKSGSLHAYECDITDDDRLAQVFKEVVEKYGPIYLCVNNAGFSKNQSLLDGNPKTWRAIMDVNVIALSHLTQLAVLNMKENKTPGHVINISSIVGHKLIPVPEISFYSSTKFAVKVLTEAMRMEVKALKPKIRISSISPGVVETEFQEASGNTKAEADKFYNVMSALKASDVAETLMHMLNAPDTVEIQDVIIQPNSEYSG